MTLAFNKGNKWCKAAFDPKNAEHFIRWNNQPYRARRGKYVISVTSFGDILFHKVKRNNNKLKYVNNERML